MHEMRQLPSHSQGPTSGKFPGCPAAGGQLSDIGKGRIKGERQGEAPRSFVFNELSLREIAEVESALVRSPVAIC